MLISVLKLLGGGLLLYFGAERLVRGAAQIAAYFGVSALMIGLTVVAFGTSTPEMAVSIKAALEGFGGVSLGNVVGSNIFNIAVILGLSALIRPLRVNVEVLKIDTPLMVFFSLLFAGLLLDGLLSGSEALLLLFLMLGYLGLTLYFGKKSSAEVELPGKASGTAVSAGFPWLETVLMLVGLLALLAGSNFLVQAALSLAEFFGISPTLVALTVVAGGTSLPELATSMVAALKNQQDIAIGNIVGSNIFNLLAICGVSGVLVPLKAQGIQIFDYLFMICLALLLLPLMRSGFRISRLEGILLLLVYGAYLVYLWP